MVLALRNRRPWFRFGSMPAWVALLASLLGGSAAELPNVLILLIDDLGRSDLGIDGSTFYETPRLDALARSGVRFTNFYASHPVCSPTRASLMTGKAPQRTGITDWIHPGSGIALSAAEITLAEAFLEQGYQTAYLGKWHLGETDADHPTRHGFEWTLGVNRAGQPASYYFPYRQSETASSVWDVPGFADGKPGDYLTDALTSGAIRFLRERDPQRPFFLCFGHYAVHTPIQPPAGLADQFQAKRIRLHGHSSTPNLPAPFGAISRARQDHADYAAMIANLDSNIGRLLEALSELGLRHNTIVVLSSDNGGLSTLARGEPGPTTNLPWRAGKGWTYEGGLRVPAFISWPAQLSPRTIEVPGITADLYPTLLELCSLPPKPRQHLDGRSLAPVLRGQPDSALENRPLAWYYPHDHGSGHKASAALRLGDWKLIHYLSDHRNELYHLGDDPGEQHNLADRHPERTRAMQAQLFLGIHETRN